MVLLGISQPDALEHLSHHLSINIMPFRIGLYFISCPFGAYSSQMAAHMLDRLPVMPHRAADWQVRLLNLERDVFIAHTVSRMWSLRVPVL